MSRNRIVPGRNELFNLSAKRLNKPKLERGLGIRGAWGLRSVVRTRIPIDHVDIRIASLALNKLGIKFLFVRNFAYIYINLKQIQYATM